MGVEVLKDEADKKREEMRERMRLGDPGADITRVENRDPKYRYRGINKDPRRVARAKAKGFEAVPADDPARWPIEQEKGKEFGDLVLMREPMELYEAKKQADAEKAAAATRAHRDNTKERINQIAREAGAVGPHQDAVIDPQSENIKEI